MFRLEWLFLMQLLMGILMIFFLQKLTQMKKQVDEITREVMNYISYVTEDMEEESIQETSLGSKTYNTGEKHVEAMNKKEREEAQNRLIQAVLGEYFQ